MTDGLVRYTSAHLDGAVSETIVTSTHVCVEADPEVIAEVRRILTEHRGEAVPSGLQDAARGIREGGLSHPFER